jgi:hypothetical protein
MDGDAGKMAREHLLAERLAFDELDGLEAAEEMLGGVAEAADAGE